MLFILFSNCSFAVVSLVRAIIKPVEWIMWPGKTYRGLDEEMEGRMGLHCLSLVFECPMTVTTKTLSPGCATKCPHFWMCVHVWICTVCQEKGKDFQDISCWARKDHFFFCLLFFPLVFHLMLLQWSLFSFFSFLPWFNTKAQCFRIFALYVVFFLLSFWSSWWSPVPPLLPFEHWNSHGKDLVQLLVSLLFFGTEQADGIKTSLTSQFVETCKENFQISLLLLSFCILPEQWRLKASWSLGYWAAGMYTSLKAMEILGHDLDMLRNESFQEE